MKDYRKLTYKLHNMDVYYPLTKKVNIIKYISNKYFKGRLLDVGCGEMPYKTLIHDTCDIDEYVGLDIENEGYQKENNPDLFWDGNTMPITDNSFNCAMLIEVLEHVPKPEIVLNEIHRVLQKDSHLVITIPFLWNLHDAPYDEYRYTPFALKRILESCNYQIVEMEAFGGWHASLATMLALYSRRALFGKKRFILSKITKPIIAYLHKKDSKTDKTIFKDGQMITGLWCVAKPLK